MEHQEKLLAELDAKGLGSLFAPPEEPKFESKPQDTLTLGTVGDALAGAAGWAIGVDQQAVIESVQDAGKAVIDTGADLVGSTIGVSGESVKQATADMGRTMIKSGEEHAAAGAHLVGGAEILAGQALASLAPEDIQKPHEQTYEEYVNMKLGAGNQTDLRYKDFVEGGGGSTVPGAQKQVITQKVKVANPKFDQNDPSQGPEFFEEDKQVIV